MVKQKQSKHSSPSPLHISSLLARPGSVLTTHPHFSLPHCYIASPQLHDVEPKQMTDASPFLASDPEKGDMHPDARRKPRPEFEGETNPNTGEVGGPKNDPLKYEKEWTYGGRATDF